MHLDRDRRVEDLITNLCIGFRTDPATLKLALNKIMKEKN